MWKGVHFSSFLLLMREKKSQVAQIVVVQSQYRFQVHQPVQAVLQYHSHHHHQLCRHLVLRAQVALPCRFQVRVQVVIHLRSAVVCHLLVLVPVRVAFQVPQVPNYHKSGIIKVCYYQPQK